MIGAVVLAGFAFALQGSVTPAGSPSASGARSAPKAATDTGVAATRADVAPTIDANDDDPVWRLAPPITQFKEWRPNEGKEPRFKTEAKVAYDAANLYVIVRSFD